MEPRRATPSRQLAEVTETPEVPELPVTTPRFLRCRGPRGQERDRRIILSGRSVHGTSCSGTPGRRLPAPPGPRLGSPAWIAEAGAGGCPRAPPERGSSASPPAPRGEALHQGGPRPRERRPPSHPPGRPDRGASAGHAARRRPRPRLSRPARPRPVGRAARPGRFARPWPSILARTASADKRRRRR